MKLYTVIGLGACLLLAGCITTEEQKSATVKTIEEQVRAYSTFPQIARFAPNSDKDGIVVSVRFPESWEVKTVGSEDIKILGMGRFRDPNNLPKSDSKKNFQKTLATVVVDHKSLTGLVKELSITKNQFRTICKQKSFWGGFFETSKSEEQQIKITGLNGDPAALAKFSVTRERLGKKLSTTMYSLGVCVDDQIVSVLCVNSQPPFSSVNEQRETENALNRFCRGIFNTVSIRKTPA